MSAISTFSPGNVSFKGDCLTLQLQVPHQEGGSPSSSDLLRCCFSHLRGLNTTRLSGTRVAIQAHRVRSSSSRLTGSPGLARFLTSVLSDMPQAAARCTPASSLGLIKIRASPLSPFVSGSLSFSAFIDGFAPQRHKKPAPGSPSRDPTPTPFYICHRAIG